MVLPLKKTPRQGDFWGWGIGTHVQYPVAQHSWGKLVPDTLLQASVIISSTLLYLFCALQQKGPVHLAVPAHTIAEMLLRF